MFKAISKTLILTGFLFVSALAFSQSECNADNYMDFIYTEGTHNCDLREADLRQKDLSEANFKGADCRGADFWLSRLSEADFTGANCAGANFDRTIVHGTIFKDTNLQDAEMRWLYDVDFFSDYFDGAIFTGTKIDGRRQGLDYAISQGAIWSPYDIFDFYYDQFFKWKNGP